nr:MULTISPECIES: hypothetical protein [Novosphingobium]
MPPLRPTGTIGLTAVMAEHRATQYEIERDIFSGRCFRIALQAILHRAECRKANDWLVLALTHVDAPFGVIQIASVVNAFENFEHALD